MKALVVVACGKRPALSYHIHLNSSPQPPLLAQDQEPWNQEPGTKLFDSGRETHIMISMASPPSFEVQTVAKAGYAPADWRAQTRLNLAA
jgi:hypothetical protein